MAGRPLRLAVRALGALACALAVNACATAGGPAQPSPFPTAPVPAEWQPPAVPEHAAPPVQSIVTSALALRGIRYQLGGDDPQHGFDCSGLVHYVYSLYKVALPRTVAEQYQVGKKESLKTVRAGDLVFFHTSGSGATHVGLAIGDDRFVHAPGKDGVVRTESLATPYWRDRFVGARRIG